MLVQEQKQAAAVAATFGPLTSAIACEKPLLRLSPAADVHSLHVGVEWPVKPAPLRPSKLGPISVVPKT
jgi:hypothetical protein